MKTIPWILCAVLFIALLYVQTCNTKPVAVPQGVYDALKKSKDDTVKYFTEIIKADAEAINHATAHAEQSAQVARESEDKLTESQEIIARQNAKIEAGKKEKPNERFIPMSPDYIDGCDSLKLMTEHQDIVINRHKRDNAALAKAKDQEIATRDNKLIDQQNFNISLQKQLDTCQLKIKDKESVKIKNQWYAEIGLMGNKVNPVGGGEAGITLINKRGVMYGLKAQVSAGQVWYGVKTGVRLFK
jgi:hypothetical protein